MPEIRQSKFTYRDLERLAKYSVDTPLRVIAHIDLDAFYAQCETVRLGIDENEPLAVQQWENLIAINYPARALGLTTRHVSAVEAQKLVPSLRLVHVATWKCGSTHWSYPEPGTQDISNSKACLDPYRIASKKILNIFRRNCERVEKSSVDESFLDLSKMVGERVRKRFNEVVGIAPPYGDVGERLPLPSVLPEELEWSGSTVVEISGDEKGVGEGEGLEKEKKEGEDEEDKEEKRETDEEVERKKLNKEKKEEYTEDSPLDWDDVCLAIAAEIVADIRKQVRTELKYTCSAGVARNKMLAKLASGYKKPNNQTVVRARAINLFLSGIKFTKIRNLGGKLGTQISETFTTTHIPTLLTIPLSTLSTKLPPDTALWLYNTLRGVDRSEVNPRTLIKSMLSAKSFRPSLKSPRDALGWLKVFVADISGRMREEGCLQPGGRRPKIMSLGWRGGRTCWGTGGKSKGCTLPMAGELGDQMLLGLAEGLLRGIEDWPCGNLSLTLGGFEETESGKGIMGFLVRGGVAKVGRDEGDEGGGKRRKVDEGGGKGRKVEGMNEDGIRGFFVAAEDGDETDDRDWIKESGHDLDENIENASNSDFEVDHLDDTLTHSRPPPKFTTPSDLNSSFAPPPPSKSIPKPRFFTLTQLPKPSSPLHLPTTPSNPESQAEAEATLNHPCSKCHTLIPINELSEHEDWHFAKELVEEERRTARAAAAPPPATQSNNHGKEKRKGNGGGGGGARGVEKGQRKLVFGK
ncbi:hypothetical protein EV426DRAFT_557426 [Tirmania nivea]|nr:hypothetical protein EV426DRAFT_557426 [Tirmania nivea]